MIKVSYSWSSFESVFVQLSRQKQQILKEQKKRNILTRHFIDESSIVLKCIWKRHFIVLANIANSSLTP